MAWQGEQGRVSLNHPFSMSFPHGGVGHGSGGHPIGGGHGGGATWRRGTCRMTEEDIPMSPLAFFNDNLTGATRLHGFYGHDGRRYL